MFEHVTVLLSFVYALALTHLLQSTTDLILARDRVRFSALLATWMTISLLVLFNNWISLWSLNRITHWTLGEIAMQFATAIVQYFTCSLVSIKVERGEPADMRSFYEDQRVAIQAAIAGLMVLAMIGNYIDRFSSHGGPNDWIGADAIDALTLIPSGLAAFAKPKWLQWAGALIMLGFVGLFLWSYTNPS